MVGLLTALLLLAAASHGAAQTDSLESERVVGLLGERLDSQLTRFADYGFSGTVLVVRDRSIVLLKGYGLADAERGIRNGAATRFEMNSMTKMFTGVALLQLAAGGRLDLDDPVERYLGAVPAEKRGATIRHLATHTSGLVVAGTPLAGDTRDAFVRDVMRAPREAAAGAEYRYTNAGFSLLAAIIETASGQTYETYLRQHIFEPAGMRTAIFRDELPPRDSLFAQGYVGSPAGRTRGPPNPYVWGTRGAGGIWSTVGDIYRWLVAVEDGVVVPNSKRTLLFSMPAPPSEEAFGWHVRMSSAGNRAQIDKGGGSSDFASQLLYYPDDRVTIIWASNDLRQRWRRTLNQTLPEIMFGGSPAPPPHVTRLPPAALAARAGRYRAAGNEVEFRATGDHLYAVANGVGVPTNVMLLAQDSTTFTGFDPAAQTITRVLFGSRDAGEVTIVLHDGRRITARRVR